MQSGKRGTYFKCETRLLRNNYRLSTVNRKQFVSIDNCNSSTKTILTGVPQGSVLRPLLFLKYTNDQHKCVKHSKTYHFADDTNILQSGKSLDVLAKKLNQDRKILWQWLKANKLSLNIIKLN